MHLEFRIERGYHDRKSRLAAYSRDLAVLDEQKLEVFVAFCHLIGRRASATTFAVIRVHVVEGVEEENASEQFDVRDLLS